MTEQEFEWFVARRAEDLATIQRTERERDEARAAVLKLRKALDFARYNDDVKRVLADTESYEEYR